MTDTARQAAAMANDRHRWPNPDLGSADFAAHSDWCDEVCDLLRTLAAQPAATAGDDWGTAINLAEKWMLQLGVDRSTADMAKDIVAALAAKGAAVREECAKIADELSGSYTVKAGGHSIPFKGYPQVAAVLIVEIVIAVAIKELIT